MKNGKRGEMWKCGNGEMGKCEHGISLKSGEGENVQTGKWWKCALHVALARAKQHAIRWLFAPGVVRMRAIRLLLCLSMGNDHGHSFSFTPIFSFFPTRSQTPQPAIPGQHVSSANRWACFRSSSLNSCIFTSKQIILFYGQGNASNICSHCLPDCQLTTYSAKHTAVQFRLLERDKTYCVKIQSSPSC